MKKKRYKSKTEYSKLILRYLIGLQIFITLTSVCLMFYTHDASPLEWLIPSVSAELSIAVGFYYNKAKRENELKIQSDMKRYGLDYIEEDEDE